MNRETAPTTYWIALGATGAIFLGSLGPWATALGGIVSKNGTEGDGVITLVCALVALTGLWAYWQKPRFGAAVGVLFLGVLILAVGIYDLVDIENTVEEDAASILGGEDVVSAGWGLWLVVVGSGILSLASLDLARR